MFIEFSKLIGKLHVFIQKGTIEIEGTYNELLKSHLASLSTMESSEAGEAVEEESDDVQKKPEVKSLENSKEMLDKQEVKQH